jgi:tetratricopeptide (TPR) repeat protein/serine/threonine protein kinase
MNEEHPNAPRLSEIFNEAKVRPPGAERDRFLAEACCGDARFQAEVEQLLRAYEDASRFLKPGRGISPELEAQFAALKPEEAGDQIGHYKLLQQIGAGGFGVVWMAEQLEPVRRRVALKIIKLGMDTKEVVARFEQERQALAMMDHPNIARVLDAGATPTGRPYFVMELVRGIKITEYCDQSTLATADRLQLFIAVCHAVQHAHQKGIIHRDLKPSNILVTLHDGVPVPKVIDFGVAKATQSQRLTDLTLFTQFEQMIGTPLYMSPEQAEMSGLDIDTRSDIYSLGVLLYELLVGRTPFDPERLLRAGHDEIRRVIREEDPPKPSTALSTMQREMQTNVARHRDAKAVAIAGLLRGDLDWIVMKALEKDRARRYETASAFAADVQRYLTNEPVAASPPSTVYRLRKFARRNKGGLAIALLVLFFLVLAGSGVGWALRDRTARHAQVAGQVTSILAEVSVHEGKQKWPEALVAARQAEAVATAGQADATTRQRVRERLKDVEFINRLEQIRMQQAVWIEGKFDIAGSDREYARAFRDYGLDVEDDSALTRSIGQFKGRPHFAIPVAAALDIWAEARLVEKQKSAASKLVALARGIDPEPVRERLRATWGKPTSELRDEVQRLAESIDVRAQHPQTLLNLAEKLMQAGLTNLALRLLHAAQSEYPADFWVNYILAHQLAEQNDDEGAVRFYTAAVALRPNAVAALNNLGIALREQGKMAEATAALRRAVEVDPQFGYGFSNLALLFSDDNKLDDAAAAYRTAIKLDPKNKDAHANFGILLHKQKKLDDAIAEFRKAIELDSKNAEAHYGLGAVLSDEKNLDEAMVYFLKAVELAPKHAKAHHGIGRTLWLQNKLNEAIVACRKAIELDPKNAMPQRTLAVALEEQNQLEEAATAILKAIELDSKNATDYYVLGNILAKQNKMDKAIAAYRQAIKRSPNDGLFYNNLGNALRAQGNMDEAVAAHLKAVELDPKNAGAYFNLGIGLRVQNKLEEAIAAYRQAIEIEPNSANLYSNLGVVLAEQKKLNEAIAAYRKAIELDPNDASAYNNLGNALKHEGKVDEAIAGYRKAIELDPNHDPAYNNLGIVLANQKNWEEAVVFQRKALDLNPNSAAAHSNLGASLCDGLLDYEGAATCFRKAIELDPKFAIAHANLGEALRHQGKVTESIAAYEKAVALDPQLAPAHNGLAWLLANCDDAALRDPTRAIDLAKKGAELAPGSWDYLNTLGVACYRAGDWEAALIALERSTQLREGGNSYDWFFLAMAHWQLGKKDKARQWYDKAVDWMEKSAPGDKELIRFRAEAGGLLGVNRKN